MLKGAKTVIAEPDGTVTVAPFENPALASGGTGDVLAGMIGALLAQGLAPCAAARLGVYLHGLAGEAVRERLGDAGLLAVATCPTRSPIVRKRLAAIAERQRRGSGSGSACARGPRGGRRAGRRPAGPAPERGPSESRRRRASPSRRASRPRACRRSRGRPGPRSTSTRSRPTSRPSGGSPALACACEPVVKADAYGHGAVAGRAGARCGRRRRALASRRWTRRSSSATRGSSCRSSSSTRCRPSTSPPPPGRRSP